MASVAEARFTGSHVRVGHEPIAIPRKRRRRIARRNHGSTPTPEGVCPGRNTAMSFSIEFADETQEYQARIKVIGCGGSGGNAVNTMINFGLEGVEFIVVNTDAQALERQRGPDASLHIGAERHARSRRRRGPRPGRKAARRTCSASRSASPAPTWSSSPPGMGGGTGTGAAPVIAQLAREEGALTVGVVTKPFLFEGSSARAARSSASQQLSRARRHAHHHPEPEAPLLGDDDLSFVDACRKADEVLYQAVKGISDLITQNGIVNVDFADVRRS